MIEVRYFAWLRERIGERGETVETTAATPRELIAELRAKSEAHDLAFSDIASIRVALDQTLAEMDAPLEGVREVAFFPPMTGG